MTTKPFFDAAREIAGGIWISYWYLVNSKIFIKNGGYFKLFITLCFYNILLSSVSKITIRGINIGHFFVRRRIIKNYIKELD